MSGSIRIENLTVKLSNRDVIGSAARGLDLTLESGRIHCLLGPSGCGKTTLLRILAGLEPVTSGKIEGLPHQDLSFVFQDPRLIPWLTTQENIQKVPGTFLRMPPDDLVLKILDELGLLKFKDFFPHQLSGGMKMRASVARALVTSPKTILFDEPYSALDEQTRHHLQKMTLDIHKKQKTTFVFVTHSISEAVFLADRILIMSAAGGKIIFDENVQFSERNSALRTSADFNGWVRKISEAMAERS